MPCIETYQKSTQAETGRLHMEPTPDTKPTKAGFQTKQGR